jgi:uncharacterized protein (TIGR02679 family)
VSDGRAVPESLRQPGLTPLWGAARRQLDRNGGAHRGTVATPDVTASASLALQSLLGRPLRRRVALADLEEALVARAVGHDLDDALTNLGHPPSPAAAARHETRERKAAARRSLDAVVEGWAEPWARGWAEGVRRAGLIADLPAAEVTRLATDVRRLLDRPTGSTSRTEVAAQLFGSAHALDPGTRRAALVTHALRHLVGSLEGRELWEAAGILPDQVSAPALTWRLPARGEDPVAQQIRAANDGQVPLHLSLYAIRRFIVTVPEGTPVFVVENPRIVEAAAEQLVPACLIAANGNPSTAVTTLLGQLGAAGARLHYHGDFDTPGIAICNRMHLAGLEPWRMGGADYRSALRRADETSTALARDAAECIDTPWDASLADAFRSDRRIVHEELIVDDLLAAMTAATRQP